MKRRVQRGLSVSPDQNQRIKALAVRPQISEAAVVADRGIGQRHVGGHFLMGFAMAPRVAPISARLWENRGERQRLADVWFTLKMADFQGFQRTRANVCGWRVGAG